MLAKSIDCGARMVERRDAGVALAGTVRVQKLPDLAWVVSIICDEPVKGTNRLRGSKAGLGQRIVSLALELRVDPNVHLNASAAAGTLDGPWLLSCCNRCHSSLP